MKCANGKYKYGAEGSCVFDTLEACKQAAAAIHIPKAMVPVAPVLVEIPGYKPDCTSEDIQHLLDAQYK